ncbi:MAG: efflux RND transporter periplasmic adaptor subunit [Deltaproteobacteria bacterium]|nr:efflux RND transporter periplasmic adaptor subunit [Deltaproteobacteria bacterium]
MNDGILKKLLFRVFIPGLILLVGGACAGALVIFAPSARRGDQEVAPPLVEVVIVKRTDAVARVEASGVVVPAREVSITPEVSGRIIAV